MPSKSSKVITTPHATIRPRLRSTPNMSGAASIVRCGRPIFGRRPASGKKVIFNGIFPWLVVAVIFNLIVLAISEISLAGGWFAWLAQ